MPEMGDDGRLGLESESLRENVLYGLLVREDIASALAEVESWASWPTDDIGLWLVLETFFQSRRLDCVPILERMLRTRGSRDGLNVVRMEEMIEAAKRWT